MSYGGQDTRRDAGVAKAVTSLFEAIGLLNKGSADAQAAPDSSETSSTVSAVSTNALNVTRVSGLAALIASVGAAALGIFAVDKKHDPPSTVVAAYVSVGVIVAAALIAAAVILYADIRTRAAIATTTSPAADASKPSGSAAIRDVNGTTILHPDDDHVRVDAAQGHDVRITLVDAAAVPGKRLVIKRVDSEPVTVRVQPHDHQHLDQSDHQDLAQWETLRLYSTGTSWELE